MIGQHLIVMGNYHIAFTLPEPDADHCQDCADRAKTRWSVIAHIADALQGYEALDLRTPDLRYIATAYHDKQGRLKATDRFAGDQTPDHWTDPDAPKGRRYTRL